MKNPTAKAVGFLLSSLEQCNQFRHVLHKGLIYHIQINVAVIVYDAIAQAGNVCPRDVVVRYFISIGQLFGVFLYLDQAKQHRVQQDLVLLQSCQSNVLHVLADEEEVGQYLLDIICVIFRIVHRFLPRPLRFRPIAACWS